MSHLSQEQLLAVRDGESEDRAVRDHLVTCPKCRRAFDDSRWRLVLQRLVGDGSKHPSGDRLLAYWYDALSPESARGVQRHLRGCNRCLAIYERLRGGDAAATHLSPKPSLLEKVRARYVVPSRPARELGVVWLRRMGEVLGLEYAADVSVEVCGSSGVSALRAMDLMQAEAMVDDEALDECLSAEVEEAATPRQHPAAASSRRRRLAKTRDSKQRRGPTEIDAGGLQLVLALKGGNGPGLVIHARFTDTREPAAGIGVRLESDRGDNFEARTDESGSATVPFPAGASRLVIRGPYPTVLTLSNLP